MASKTYRVEGMTCEHCVRAVTDEVSKVAGVTHVDVDLAGGTVEVTGEALDDGAVAAAVDEAGYSLGG